MPELPEAETVARRLRERLSGAVITDCRVGRDDIIREGLSTRSWYRGARLASAGRLGKSVVLECEKRGDTRFLVFELGMTGLLFFTLLHPSYRKHTHLTLSLTGSIPALYYWNPRRFGRVYLLDRSGLERFAARRFGCDPLTVTWEEFRALVGKRRGRLKALLMHQQVIAGIGNIYANEILWHARLHPYRTASKLRAPAVRRLYDSMRDVLLEAIEAGGSSVRDFLAPDGTKGEYWRQHRVYNKAGQPCPSGCGRTIRRLKGERSSFFCPACQRK
jgi:formamidopyrimidine-DNA glycosylase